MINKMISQADYLIGQNIKVFSRKNIKKILVERSVKFDPFFWNNGLLVLALDRFGGNENLPNYNRLQRKKVRIEYIDDALFFYANFDKLSKADATGICNFIKNYPKDSHGSVLYRSDKKNDDIFADSLGMICPFLFRYAEKYNDNEARSLAMKQFVLFRANSIDKKTLLPYHGYSVTRDEKYGVIGWGRAVGWMVFGLVECMRHIEADTLVYQDLKQILVETLGVAKDYLRPSHGFSWQLQTFEGPFDMSTTAMIGYAMAYANNISENKPFEKEIDTISSAINANIDSNGRALRSSAECGGFSQYPQMYEFNSWGQAFAMLYFAEARR